MSQPIPIEFLIITPIVVFALWGLGIWYVKKEAPKYNNGETQ